MHPQCRAVALHACCHRAQAFGQPGTTPLPTSHNARQPQQADQSESSRHAGSPAEPPDPLAQVHLGRACGNAVASTTDLRRNLVFSISAISIARAYSTFKGGVLEIAALGDANSKPPPLPQRRESTLNIQGHSQGDHRDWRRQFQGWCLRRCNRKRKSNQFQG